MAAMLNSNKNRGYFDISVQCCKADDFWLRRHNGRRYGKALRAREKRAWRKFERLT